MIRGSPVGKGYQRAEGLPMPLDVHTAEVNPRHEAIAPDESRALHGNPQGPQSREYPNGPAGGKGGEGGREERPGTK